MSPSLVNQVRRAALAGLAVSLAAIAWSGPAAAADAGGKSGTVATGRGALYVRSGPSLTADDVSVRANGSRLVLLCQVKGDRVGGFVRTTTMWNKIKGGGYVSDAYIKRSGKLPACAKLKARSTATTAGPTEWRRPVSARIWSGFHTKERRDHDGVDIGALRGTRIRAAADGTVIVATCNSSRNCDKDGSPSVTGCGWYVDILHAGGIVTRYCHMVTKPYVKVGQKVTRAQVLGRVGSSGNSSGPHLHFEVHVPPKAGAKAQPVDPVKFFADKGIDLDVR